LNKKSWHTGGFASIEEVWKREQQAEHEKRKLEEMKKEILEERKLSELRQDAIDAGHSKKSERLDWMYKGSLAEGTRLEDTKFTRADGEEEPEVLKRERERKEDLPAERPDKPLLPDMDDPKQKVEQWNKMNNDPLLAMKQREMQARENIASNPVRREQIKREVDDKKKRKKEKAREKKERKRAKKERKEEKYREKIRDEVREEEKSSRRRRRRRHRDDNNSSSESESDSGSSSTSSYSGRRRRERGGRDDRRKRRHYSRSPSPPHLRRVKSRIEREKDDRYGMSYANERAEHAAEARRNQRREWRESNEQEKDKERCRADLEEQTKWDSRKNSVGHKAGKLSQEEKERRLREMNEAANNYDSHRSSRRDKLDDDLKETNKEIYRELDGKKSQKDTPSFLNYESKRAYSGGS
jgi:hypothetical protein